MKNVILLFSYLSLVFLISCDSSVNPAGYIGGACNNNYCLEGICVDGKCVPDTTDGDIDLDKIDSDEDRIDTIDIKTDLDKSVPTDGDDLDNDKTVPVDGDSADIEEESDTPTVVWTDPRTGFMWEKTSEFSKVKWIKALNYCDELELAGFKDWRLPNISELRTIVRGCSSIETAGECRVKDKCEVCGVEPINVCLAAMCWKLDDCDSTSCKDNGGSSGCYWPKELDGSCYDYWSSSLRDDNSGDVWYTHFLKGSVLSKNKELTNYVRCVRTAGPPEDGDLDEIEKDVNETDKTEQAEEIETSEPETEPEIEPEPEIEEEACNSHASFKCESNDVYWYDSCDQREDKKEECGADGCSAGKCNFLCTTNICTDPATGFEWQKTPTGGEMKLNDAKTHCNNLSLDGKDDWRLPNISELRSIVRNCSDIQADGACGIKAECSACGVGSDKACLNFSCFTASTCKPSSCSDDGGPDGCYWPKGLSGSCHQFWSSSFLVNSTNYEWGVQFYTGEVYNQLNALKSFVRCVRGGQ